MRGRAYRDGKGIDVRWGVLNSPSPGFGTSPEVVPRQVICQALGLGRKYHRRLWVSYLHIAPSNVAIILLVGIHHNV